MGKIINNLRSTFLLKINRWSDDYNFARIELWWLRFSAKRYYHQNTEIISRKEPLNMRINRLLKSLIEKQGSVELRSVNQKKIVFQTIFLFIREKCVKITNFVIAALQKIKKDQLSKIKFKFYKEIHEHTMSFVILICSGYPKSGATFINLKTGEKLVNPFEDTNCQHLKAVAIAENDKERLLLGGHKKVAFGLFTTKEGNVVNAPESKKYTTKSLGLGTIKDLSSHKTQFITTNTPEFTMYQSNGQSSFSTLKTDDHGFLKLHKEKIMDVLLSKLKTNDQAIVIEKKLTPEIYVEIYEFGKRQFLPLPVSTGETKEIFIAPECHPEKYTSESYEKVEKTSKLYSVLKQTHPLLEKKFSGKGQIADIKADEIHNNDFFSNINQ